MTRQSGEKAGGQRREKYFAPPPELLDAVKSLPGATAPVKDPETSGSRVKRARFKMPQEADATKAEKTSAAGEQATVTVSIAQVDTLASLDHRGEDPTKTAEEAASNLSISSPLRPTTQPESQAREASPFSDERHEPGLSTPLPLAMRRTAASELADITPPKEANPGSLLRDDKGKENREGEPPYKMPRRGPKAAPQPPAPLSFTSAPVPAPAPAPAPAVPQSKSSKVSGTGPVSVNWVDAHAPKHLGEIVGNCDQVRQLAQWLKGWGEAPDAQKKGSRGPNTSGHRAALVSGPPGIGKTTTCRLVASLAGGYEVLEYNASDARGQKIIQEMAEGIAENTTLNLSNGRAGTRRAVIIMDEVDGMSSGDRGGTAALIKMIKKTRNPIICIGNDQQSQQMRNLASNCFHVKFERPSRAAVAQRCFTIAKRSGLQVTSGLLEDLAESCGCDFRMVLNHLQMMSGPEKALSTTRTAKGDSTLKDQEVMTGPFDACKKLLTNFGFNRISLEERLNLHFVDYDLVPLLVQENYLRSVEKKFDDSLLERCALAADCMTIGDVLNEKVRTGQEWDLLPTAGVFSSVCPTSALYGYSHLMFTCFPSTLSKFSTVSRGRRLAAELCAPLRLSSTQSRKNLISSGYTDLLYGRLIDPLRTSAVPETAALLKAYGLSKEHLAEHLTDLRKHLDQEDAFKSIDAKVKTALTRECNTGASAIRVPPKVGQSKRKLNDGEGEYPLQEEAAEDMEDETAGSDTGGVESCPLVKVKRSGGKKGGASGTASAVQEPPSTKAPGRSRGKATAKSKAATRPR